MTPPAPLLPTDVETLPRDAATIVPIARVERRDSWSPEWTTLPFARPVYDARHDRFVLPGFYAVERSGRVTYGLEVLQAGGPPELAHQPLDRRRANHRLVAIWHGAESTVVLHGSMAPDKDNPHACRNPETIQVTIFAKDGETVRSRYLLVLADGWDTAAALDRFLLDGNLIAPVNARRSYAFGGPGERGRWLGGTIGRRSATIRIDALGRVSVLPRDKRVHALARGAELTRIATPDGGACRLMLRENERELACVDNAGRLRWARRIPKAASGEIVGGDDGRLYLGTVDGVIALDARGTPLWRWTGRAPRHGTMMIAGPEVCFFADSPGSGPAMGTRTLADPATDLVCLPRRGPS